MFIIGITGGTGSGKTTALEAIEELGGFIIDCDALYHELIQNNKQMLDEIGARFEGTVENGVLYRKKLGQLVFNNTDALSVLNAITHKYVDIEVKRLLGLEAEAGRKLAAIDAIALIESGLGKLCDITVAITAPVEERVRRLITREGISEKYAQLRISAQKSDEWYMANCDLVLENSGGKIEFKKYCLDKFSAIINQ